MKNKPIQICVSICERTPETIQLQAERADKLSDLIEVRLDCVDQEVHSLRDFKGCLPVVLRPVIATYRPAEQGGVNQLTGKRRLLFWLFNRPAADFFDVEFDIATTPSVFDSDKDLDWSRVISSYHNFRGVPADLLSVYERMARTRARILKIAVQAHDITDCLPVFDVLHRGLVDGYEMIAIAMGEPGLITRILGPSRGAFLTYASLEDDKATAPGQISVKDLREVYRIETINRDSQVMGLVGQPVAHSLSPHMHNRAFAALGLNAVYLPLEVKDLKAFISRMVHPLTRELNWNMVGLSVTAPHKTAVMDLLDWVDASAQEIGAVNTIVVNGPELRGYNTDAGGFIKPLLARCGELKGLRCAVIGTGGAAAAAVWSLRQQDAEVTVFGRAAVKARTFAERFGVTWQSLEDAVFNNFSIVINATSLGTAGVSESETPAKGAQLAGASFAYDLVYNPTPTRFLREAESVGCETLNGLEMLIGQAAAQFKLWTGSEAPEREMREAANRAVR